MKQLTTYLIVIGLTFLLAWFLFGGKKETVTTVPVPTVQINKNDSIKKVLTAKNVQLSVQNDSLEKVAVNRKKYIDYLLSEKNHNQIIQEANNKTLDSLLAILRVYTQTETDSLPVAVRFNDRDVVMISPLQTRKIYVIALERDLYRQTTDSLLNLNSVLDSQITNLNGKVKNYEGILKNTQQNLGMYKGAWEQANENIKIANKKTRNTKIKMYLVAGGAFILGVLIAK